MGPQITCPYCRKVLTSPHPVAAGSKVKCLGCRRTFVTAAAPPAVPVVRTSNTAVVGAALGVLGLALVAGIALAFYCFTAGTAGTAKTEPDLAQLPPTKVHPLTKDPTGTAPGNVNKAGGEQLSAKEAPGPKLPPDVQKQVDEAIGRGAQFLKSQQRPDGTWQGIGGHPVGYTALPALTLLECGIPRDDPKIQAAAKVVRDASDRLDQTYELALAILFLDKLGDPADKRRIQSLALRLVAGQNDSGGWTYVCNPVTPATQQELLTFLQKERAYRLTHFVGKDELANPLRLTQADLGRTPSQDPASERFPPGSAPANKDAPGGAAGKGPAVPASVSRLPIFNPDGPARNFGKGGIQGDHSNTQFALLGLWVARRYDIPLERTLSLAELRFRRLQLPEGNWYYQPNQFSNAMTCVGLLGLAVGRGIEYELLHLDKTLQGSAVQKLTAQDDGIQKGLKRLGQMIGTPRGRTKNLPQMNLYFLWSVERVAVLYGLASIGNKDWYLWGTEVLLANQQGNGCWTGGGYYQAHPVIDTCFALLFLKRANLAPDLSDNLRSFIPVVDPDRRGGSENH